MKRVTVLLALIVFVALAARLFFAFTTPYFTYESYFHLRQVEHIGQTGLPLYQDTLSYGGRTFLFLPLFHYLLAFFDLALPLFIVAKIVPNLLLTSLPILAFLIARKISDNETGALFSALIAGFLPILFTPNAVAIESLSFPLLFLSAYAFLHLPEKRYVSLYLVAFLLLTLTSSAAFLLLMGFGIYLLLSGLEGKKIAPAEKELMLFSLFFFLWVQFLFFKNILLQGGMGFVWQNIPAAMVRDYFPQFSLVQAIILVSAIPFLAGIFVVYRSLFQLRSKKAFLLISLVLSTGILSALRLVQFHISLMFFGIVLAILFASFYVEARHYLPHTKMARQARFFSGALLIMLLVTMLPPAIAVAQTQDMPSEEQIRAFQWLQRTTPLASVAALLEEGHLVAYYGKRTTLMDDQFTLIPDVERRFSALNSLFQTAFKTQALGITDEYGIDYIVLTPQAKAKYGLEKLRYYSSDCFRRVYKNETVIYKVECNLKPIGHGR